VLRYRTNPHSQAQHLTDLGLRIQGACGVAAKQWSFDAGRDRADNCTGRHEDSSRCRPPWLDAATITGEVMKRMAARHINVTMQVSAACE
jgi:hypothetical protein